jgi:hypothetical protein
MSEQWATLYVGDKRVAGPLRADTTEIFLEDYFRDLGMRVQRKRYAEEREYAEYVDLGGEG